MHVYAYLLHSSVSVADASVLLQGAVLIKQMEKSCSIVNVNKMQVTSLHHREAGSLHVHGRAAERARREQSAYHRIFLCIHFCMIQERRSRHCLFGYHISRKCRGTLQEINYNVQFYSGKIHLSLQSVSY